MIEQLSSVPNVVWTDDDIRFRDTVALDLYREAVLKTWKPSLARGEDPYEGNPPLDELAQTCLSAATALMMARKAWPLPSREAWEIAYLGANR